MFERVRYTFPVPISFMDVVRFVWGYFLRQRMLVLVTYVLLTLNALTELANPFFIGKLVDTIGAGIAGDDAAYQSAMFFAGVLVVQSAVFHLTLRGAHLMNCVIDARVEREIATETFDRVQRFSADWHINAFAGAIVTKIRRAMASAHRAYDIVCYDIYPTVLVAIGLTTLIWLRSTMLGVLFAAFAIVYSIGSIVFVRYFVTPARRMANVADNKLGGSLADTLANHVTIRAFAGEAQEATRFDRISAFWMAAARTSWIRGNITGLLQSGTITVLKAVVLFGGVWLWHQGTFTVGDVTFLFISYNTLAAYLRTIGQEINEFLQNVSDIEDAVQYHKTPFGVADAPHAKPLKVTKGEIVLDRICFGYAGQPQPIFQDFSLTIRAGERIALVGHSGGGKTTFVKLIQRLYDVSSGMIRIDGQDIAKVTQASLHRAIALVPQEPVLFHRSLAENIAYARPKAPLAEIRRAARAAHAAEFIERSPAGYQTLVGERGVKLSGGERQRVAIARAILADSPILILDEATSSLDSISEHLIQDALKRLMQGRTTIVVAHRLSTIKKVDRILVFEGGQIVEQGTHAELVRRKSGTYRALYEMQAGGFLTEDGE